MAGPVLEIANLSVAIRGSGDRPHAVRGINITVGANDVRSGVGDTAASLVDELIPDASIEAWPAHELELPLQPRRNPASD